MTKGIDLIKEKFTPERWNELCSLVDDKGMKLIYSDFLKYELEIIIDQSNLSPEDKQFSYYKYIMNMKNIDIMDKMGWYSKNTLIVHRKRSSLELRRTCVRLFK